MIRSMRPPGPMRPAPTVGLVLILAIGLFGCSPSGLHVDMTRGSQKVSVTVMDDIGMVKSADAGTPDKPDPLPSAPAAWNPNGELTQVTVYWQSSPCATRPTLHLSGNAIQVEIDPGPVEGTCDTSLVPTFVTLHLDRVIDVSAITVTMAGS